MVAVLGEPCRGRCKSTCTCPTLATQKMPAFQPAADRHWWTGEAVGASLSPEARIAGLLLACLQTTQEGVEGQIDAYGDVVEHRRLHPNPGGPLGFEGGKCRLLIVQA